MNCELCFSKQVPLDWEKTFEMDFAIIEHVVKVFLPLGLKEIIPSTIGEPFLYSRFEDFLLLAKENNLKVNITTNGTFPNGGLEKWFYLLQPVLSDIKFSAMNGKIPGTVKAFINMLNSGGELSIKPTVTIQATLNLNDKLGEIPKGVDRIKINKAWLVNKFVVSCFEQTDGDCPFLGKHIWVWVDGTFQVCPNPDARFGMQTKFPFGDFGNFANQNPLEIWNSPKYREFCASYKTNAICKTCKMRC